MEFLGWRLCRYKILIALKNVVPTYCQQNMTAFISPTPFTAGYSPTFCWSYGWIKGIPSKFEFFWLLMNLIKCLYMFIEHLCFFSEFSGLCSFSFWIVLSFSYWFVERTGLDTNDFGKNAYIRSNWHFSQQFVCHIISSTYIDKSCMSSKLKIKHVLGTVTHARPELHFKNKKIIK